MKWKLINESTGAWVPHFEEGQYVICRNSSLEGYGIRKGDKLKAEKLRKNKWGYWFVKFQGIRKWCPGSDFDPVDEETIDAAIAFIENGGKCGYQYGFTYKGASIEPMDTKEALKEIQSGNWTFGTGFNNLHWSRDNQVLVFNELSENDMF